MNKHLPPIHNDRALVRQSPRSTSVTSRLTSPVTVQLARLKNAIPQSVQDGVGKATRRSAKVTGICLTALSVLAVLLTGALYARLYQGPISMDFLLPTIEKAVNGQIPKSSLNIAGAVIRLGENRRSIEFRLKDVSILDERGEQVAQAPLASIGISAPALLSGRIAAGQINLIEPKLVATYSEQAGPSLSFSQNRAVASDIAQPGKSAPLDRSKPALPATVVAPAEAAEALEKVQGQINLVQVLTGLFERTREQGSATSYLTEFGIKDASVYYDHGDRLTKWVIPEAVIELSHLKRRSVISGRLSVETASVPWTLDFRAEQNVKNNTIRLAASVSEITPSALAGEFGDHETLRKLNLPIAISGAADMAGNGDITAANVTVDLGKGEFYVPWEKKHPAAIDSGEINIRYSKETDRIDIEPSQIVWGASRMELTGEAVRTRGGADGGLWNFDIRSPKMIVASEEFDLPAMEVETLQMRGSYNPAIKSVALDQFLLKAGEATIALKGKLGATPESGGVNIEGVFSPMPMTFVKRVWPKFVAHGAREWVGKNMSTGFVEKALLKVSLPPDVIQNLKNDGDVPTEAVSFKIELADLTMSHIKGLPPIKAGKATATVQGRSFVLETAEEAAIDLPSGAKVVLNSGQFIVGDLRPRVPYGEVHLKASGQVSAVEELLDTEPLGYLRKAGFEPNKVTGKTSSTFSVGMPMSKDLGFKDLTIRGKTRVEDIRAKNIEGAIGVHGGALVFDVTEKAIEAQGELKVNGVPLQLAWQRIFDAPPEYQPRIRLRGILNERARDELGLPVNHIIKGNVAAELSITPRNDAPAGISVEADLANADIVVSAIGWRKPPGQRAILSFNVEKDGARSKMSNVRILGDDINVIGSVAFSDQKKPISFDFPTVTLSAQTKLEMRGALSGQNIWKINVRGSTFEGKQLFRSLFSAGGGGAAAAPAKNEPGLDLRVEIGTVLGFFDTTIKGVLIDARKRGGRLSALDVSGRLNGNAPIAVKLDSKAGEARILVAEATDAGAAFRVIGFYPAVRGGEASLKVNLDGGDGAAEKQGRLYVNNFVVVGDQVIDQVVTQAPPKPGLPARRRPVRKPISQSSSPQSQMEFDRMTVAFAVGHGQFVLQDSAINGPLLGATIRGRIDFARDTINLSGVYVPLYGINSALSGIPLLGDILSGPRGEGIFGITFAVQGAQSKPDVVVNPMSLITPGFLRGIMEFDHTPPRIIAREPERATPAPKPRASSQPPISRQ